jgi:hypothetical protein
MQYIYDKKIQEKRREQQIKFKDIDKDDWVETVPDHDKGRRK